MKCMHIADLHLGKRVNEFSLLEDQAYILDKILAAVAEEKPDALLVAGDVYDAPQPPVRAVELLDSFLTRLADGGVQAFVISGNHDSAERLGFASRLIGRIGIHLAPAYSGTVEPAVLHDQFGEVAVYMLPFVKPAVVRAACADGSGAADGGAKKIETYTDAVSAAIGRMCVDSSRRNVLVAHQFVTGGARCDSEDVSVGGQDNVDASVFAPFDYVALGHLHGPQYVGRETVRYSGTPLKYSFSEKGHKKSITVVELAEKGSVQIRTIPLVPLHDMREIRESYNWIVDKRNYAGTATDDYVHIILTDELDVMGAMDKLRVIYPNLMKLDYDNSRTRNAFTQLEALQSVKEFSPIELFSQFYRKRNHAEMSQEQQAYMRQAIEAVWSEAK